MKKLCVWLRKPVYVHCPTFTLTPPTRFSYLVCFSVPPNMTTQTHFQHFKAESWVDAVQQAWTSFYSALLFFSLLIFSRPTPPLSQAWVSGNAQRQTDRWRELMCSIKYLQHSNIRHHALPIKNGRHVFSTAHQLGATSSIDFKNPWRVVKCYFM